MKPMYIWEREPAQIFIWIMMLLVGIALGFLGAALMDKSRPKQKKPNSKQEKDDPCDTCPRWSECNGVDEECPRR